MCKSWLVAYLGYLDEFKSWVKPHLSPISRPIRRDFSYRANLSARPLPPFCVDSALCGYFHSCEYGHENQLEISAADTKRLTSVLIWMASTSGVHNISSIFLDGLFPELIFLIETGSLLCICWLSGIPFILRKKKIMSVFPVL